MWERGPYVKKLFLKKKKKTQELKKKKIYCLQDEESQSMWGQSYNQNAYKDDSYDFDDIFSLRRIKEI